MAATSRASSFILFILFTASVYSQDKISLAVSDLTPQGIKQSEATIISEQLRAELMKSSRIRMIERSQMQEILKEQGFQQSGCTNDACAVEVGQLLGVKSIVVGSVGLVGSYTVLSSRIINVATGEVLINESVRTRGGMDKMLESCIREVATSLVNKLLHQTGSPSRRGKRMLRTFLISGSAIAILGGGVGAYLALNKENNSDESVEKNVRMELP